MNKRISAILLAAVMLLGTTACRGSGSSGEINWSDFFNSFEPKETASSQPQDEKQEPSEPVAEQQFDDEYLMQLEEDIYNVSKLDEDEIIQLYQRYDALPANLKRQIINRETIINEYQKIEALIEKRKQDAAQIDALIAAIDYTNIYSKANSFLDAAYALSRVDEKTHQYITLGKEYNQIYSEVKGLNVAITEDNFWTIFQVRFGVGQLTNFGETVTTQNGFDTEWNSYLESGRITPHYDTQVRNDYATPVHVYIVSRYPNLMSQCSFYINLHQTYTGLGIIDSDIHEFELQSGTIQYDSSQGVGDYLIYVENHNATNSLWALFGVSFDWSDAFHGMNEFDVSRVEISSISGSISAPY